MTTFKMMKIYGKTNRIISNYNVDFLEMKAHYFNLKVYENSHDLEQRFFSPVYHAYITSLFLQQRVHREW